MSIQNWSFHVPFASLTPSRGLMTKENSGLAPFCIDGSYKVMTSLQLEVRISLQ